MLGLGLLVRHFGIQGYHRKVWRWRTKDRAAKVGNTCAALLCFVANTRLWCRGVWEIGLTGWGLTGDAFSLEVVYGVLNRLNGLCVVVGDFDGVIVGAELLFERHD